MNTDAPGKVRSHHLGRNAYLYVRQSSLRQVLEHTESTERQYALKQRAVALGWHHEQVVVVDCVATSAGRLPRPATAKASNNWSPRSVWGVPGS